MTVVDELILCVDKALRTLFVAAPTVRPVPGCDLPEAELTPEARRHAGALMRVNHVGEVCAQALYQGQAVTCANLDVRQALEKAAGEETEHLAWTERRIQELGAHKSVLNPVWYLGAFSIGMLAGKLGDGWNLGFLAETERQVEAHLDGHLGMLPAEDARSRAVVEQMKTDEKGHSEMAVGLGALAMPRPVKGAMRLAAGVMTRAAYRV